VRTSYIVREFDCMACPESEELFRDYGLTPQMFGSEKLIRTSAWPLLPTRSAPTRTNKLSVGVDCVAKPSAGHRLPKLLIPTAAPRGSDSTATSRPHSARAPMRSRRRSK
jgi:hypothetical protein